MKKEILQYLKTDRSFSAGVALYMKYGINNAFKKTLNLQGETRLNKDLLLEELRKIAQIPQQEFNAILNKPVEKPVLVVLKNDIPDVDPGETDIRKVELPEMVKKSIKLRDEFPFLKNPECPNELKVLVADMLTNYDQYVLAHEELFTAEGNTEALAAVAATVENYIENRAIWDELNHYKVNGTVLGVHPIFKQNEQFAELRKLTTQDLYKRKATLYNAMARVKKQLKDEAEAKPELTKQRQDSLAEKEAEYKEVLRLLNINE